jgi:hypothetical protein
MKQGISQYFRVPHDYSRPSLRTGHHGLDIIGHPQSTRPTNTGTVDYNYGRLKLKLRSQLLKDSKIIIYESEAIIKDPYRT